MGSAPPALELVDASKDYRGAWSLRAWASGRPAVARRRVLHSVSFAVRAGQIACLVGPNGSGKTTCLKLIAGVLDATEGEARVAGTPIRSGSAAVGYVPADERSFYWRMSVEENLRFFGALHGMSPVETAGRAAELAPVLELGPLRDRPFRELSAGQKARVGIARGLLHRPSALLLDEVTRSLDEGAVARLHGLLRSLADGGLAVLLTTHDLDEAAAVADVAALLVEGRLAACGAPAAVVEAARALFAGEAP